jgi:hypothetical protein
VQIDSNKLHFPFPKKSTAISSLETTILKQLGMYGMLLMKVGISTNQFKYPLLLLLNQVTLIILGREILKNSRRG